jgi:hypothetical protein
MQGFYAALSRGNRAEDRYVRLKNIFNARRARTIIDAPWSKRFFTYGGKDDKPTMG